MVKMRFAAVIAASGIAPTALTLSVAQTEVATTKGSKA
jgi:hypothetical protein